MFFFSADTSFFVFFFLQTLVNVLITILLTSTGSGSLLPESLVNPTGSGRSEPGSLQTDASPLFVSAVVKLVAMQMQALGVSGYLHFILL